MKRGYSLPEGCKDLNDALKFNSNHEPKHPSPSPQRPASLPPINGELVIPEPTSTAELAKLLNKRPFQIVADLMQLGVFADVQQILDFDTISSVTRKYGFIAKRVD